MKMALTPPRATNSVGVIGDDTLWNTIVPNILPGLMRWRPVEATAVNPHKGLVTMPLVASCDVIVIAGKQFLKEAEQALCMASKATIFIAVITREEDEIAQF